MSWREPGAREQRGRVVTVAAAIAKAPTRLPNLLGSGVFSIFIGINLQHSTMNSITAREQEQPLSGGISFGAGCLSRIHRPQHRPQHFEGLLNVVADENDGPVEFVSKPPPIPTWLVGNNPSAYKNLAKVLDCTNRRRDFQKPVYHRIVQRSPTLLKGINCNISPAFSR